ncbi:MAG: dihydrofolate reductase family protein, partial [Armatimonadota bacterium]
RDLMSVLCEGGPALAAGLVQAEAVDKYRFFYAPKVIGGEALTGIGPLGFEQMSQAVGLQLRGVERVGDDILVTATPPGAQCDPEKRPCSQA